MKFLSFLRVGSWFFLGGLGGPRGPGDPSKRWGRGPPAQRNGHRGTRGRPDPQNDRFPILKQIYKISSQSAATEHPGHVRLVLGLPGAARGFKDPPERRTKVVEFRSRGGGPLLGSFRRSYPKALRKSGGWVGGVGGGLEIFGPVFLGFRPKPIPGTPLDRRGSPGTSTSTNNQPRRRILRPKKGPKPK